MEPLEQASRIGADGTSAPACPQVWTFKKTDRAKAVSLKRSADDGTVIAVRRVRPTTGRPRPRPQELTRAGAGRSRKWVGCFSSCRLG